MQEAEHTSCCCLGRAKPRRSRMISGLSAKLVPSETTLLSSATSLHACRCPVKHDQSLQQTDQLLQLTQACMALEVTGGHCPNMFMLTPKSIINTVETDDARQV